MTWECSYKRRIYPTMVPFTLWHIPAPHSTTCPCSSSLTGSSTRSTIIYFTFTINISPLSPLHPPISSSPPPLPSASSASSSSSFYVTSPAPRTIEKIVTLPAVDPLHLSDHGSEPEHEVGPFPLSVADLLQTMNLL